MKLGSALLLVSLVPLVAADIPEKVTYEDHVLPVFQNACLNCHNPDKKKAGLDLSSYSSTLAGSDNGKILAPGDPSGSLLFRCVKGLEEPSMPPKGDRLTAEHLALLEKWILQRAPETLASKGAAQSNNVATVVATLSRPSGPPPMPGPSTAPLSLPKRVRPNPLIALAASPWAPLVALGDQKQVFLFHSDTLEPLAALPFPEGLPVTLRFSKNGQILIAGGGTPAKTGKVVLWNVETKERIAAIGNEVDTVLAADLSPDHSLLVLGGPTRNIKFYSTKDGSLLRSIKKHTDWVTAVAFSPNGEFVASADRAGGIVIWDAASAAESLTLTGHKTAVNALSFMPGLLASAGQDGNVVLWDVADGKEKKKWAAHPGGCESVNFTPEGRLVTCGRDKVAKVWDQTGKLLLTTQPLSDIALRAVLAGDTVITGDWNGKVQAFLLADGGKAMGDLQLTPPEPPPTSPAAQIPQAAPPKN